MRHGSPRARSPTLGRFRRSARLPTSARPCYLCSARRAQSIAHVRTRASTAPRHRCACRASSARPTYCGPPRHMRVPVEPSWSRTRDRQALRPREAPHPRGARTRRPGRRRAQCRTLMPGTQRHRRATPMNRPALIGTTSLSAAVSEPVPLCAIGGAGGLRFAPGTSVVSPFQPRAPHFRSQGGWGRRGRVHPLRDRPEKRCRQRGSLCWRLLMDAGQGT